MIALIVATVPTVMTAAFVTTVGTYPNNNILVLIQVALSSFDLLLVPSGCFFFLHLVSALDNYSSKKMGACSCNRLNRLTAARAGSNLNLI